MKNWKDICITPNKTIKEAMKVIDINSSRFVAVVDENELLLGTITDGDIRRGILQGIDISEPCSKIMNKKPFTIKTSTNSSEVLVTMEEQEILQVPVVNESGKIIEIVSRGDLILAPELPNQAVIMVGGLGTRLGELTSDCPKPLLPVGGRPLLETVLLNIKRSGIRDVHLAVNYKSEMIEDYFGNGSKLGLNISYIKEPFRLGTAGALGLWKSNNGSPFLVMNGDILSRFDVGLLFKHHEVHKDIATMCVRKYETQIPFGVVHTEGYALKVIEEKPSFSYMVSAGIYVLSPECLPLIEENQFLDMPQFFLKLISGGFRAGVFPVHEYWIDIGRKNDLLQADVDFDDHFQERD